ncbi:MAG: glycosyltransferase family 39 protein [Cyanobacteria bacterium SID2]|nr:glycosyltransferase family 39 protein [Cyanobacteria bacterium SID2]MBP0005372.1 glycosyltransferase family 39 protein [Cyanobacteria bacterium SBC]
MTRRPHFRWRIQGFTPHATERQIDRMWEVVLLGAAVLLFGIHLGDVPLRDWDEGTVAQVAREIWRDPQSWLHPTLHGMPYTNKPPLVHGLIALAYQFGGVTESMARLPGALLTALSVPLVYGIGRELWHRRSISIFAAFVYLTWLPVVRHGRLAMLDGAVLCFWTLLVWCSLRSRRDLRYTLGLGVAFGLICLTKGVLLGGLLGSIVIGFLLWDTPRLLQSAWFWGGLMLGSFPAVGWYAAQFQHYGLAFWNGNLLSQSAERVWSSVENHGGPPWYYLLELLKYGFPGLVFVPEGFRTAWLERNLSWAKLLLVWGSVYFAAISVMGTKLPWYVLPLYPALALLCGVSIDGFWRDSTFWGMPDTSPKPYPKVWLGIFGVLALVGWGASLVLARQYFLKMPTVDANLVLALLTLALTMTLVVFLMLQRDAQMVVVLVWGSYLSMLLFVTSSQWVWEVNEDYAVKPVAAMIREATDAPVLHTSHPYDRPSLNFYADRPVYSTSLQGLRSQWNETSNPCLLLDRLALKALLLSKADALDRAEGWYLLCRHEHPNLDRFVEHLEIDRPKI